MTEGCGYDGGASGKTEGCGYDGWGAGLMRVVDGGWGVGV